MRNKTIWIWADNCFKQLCVYQCNYIFSQSKYLSPDGLGCCCFCCWFNFSVLLLPLRPSFLLSFLWWNSCCRLWFYNHLAEEERIGCFTSFCSRCSMAISVPHRFLVVPWVDLWYVIVEFSGHTHLFLFCFRNEWYYYKTCTYPIGALCKVVVFSLILTVCMVPRLSSIKVVWEKEKKSGIGQRVCAGFFKHIQQLEMNKIWNLCNFAQVSYFVHFQRL